MFSHCREEVFKFQNSTIDWSGIDSTFKDKAIEAIYEFYCEYKKQNKKWIMLEMSRSYAGKIGNVFVFVMIAICLS